MSDKDLTQLRMSLVKESEVKRKKNGGGIPIGLQPPQSGDPKGRGSLKMWEIHPLSGMWYGFQTVSTVDGQENRKGVV